MNILWFEETFEEKIIFASLAWLGILCIGISIGMISWCFYQDPIMTIFEERRRNQYLVRLRDSFCCQGCKHNITATDQQEELLLQTAKSLDLVSLRTMDIPTPDGGTPTIRTPDLPHEEEEEIKETIMQEKAKSPQILFPTPPENDSNKIKRAKKPKKPVPAAVSPPPPKSADFDAVDENDKPPIKTKGRFLKTNKVTAVSVTPRAVEPESGSQSPPPPVTILKKRRKNKQLFAPKAKPVKVNKGRRESEESGASTQTLVDKQPPENETKLSQPVKRDSKTDFVYYGAVSIRGRVTGKITETGKWSARY